MMKRIIALLLALILTVGLLPTVALAAEGTTDGGSTGTISGGTATVGKSSVSSDTDDPTNPVHIKKSVQTDDDGTGTLTLEAYVTDPMEIVTEDVPLDIVLVLDQSGSMGDCINAGCTAEYYTFGSNSGYRTGWYKNDSYVEKNTCGATSEAYEWYSYVYNARPDTSDSDAKYYVKDGNSYREVFYCAGDNSCTKNQRHSAGWFYDLSGSHADYGNGLFGRNDNRVRETYWYGLWENYTVIYKYVAPTSGKDHVSRLDVLKQVLTSFTTKVAGKATAQANHRIAMVGFSSYTYYDNYGAYSDYKNTEILTGTNLSARSTGDSWRVLTDNGYNQIAYFPNESLSIANGKQRYEAHDNDYKNALVDVSTDNGKTGVSNAIKALTAYGGTYTDYGLDMAYQILNRNKPAEGSKRQQVVILFTDGETATNHQDSAKTNANKLKQLGATVYTVGLFADTQTAYDTDMSDMSSNTTEKTGYYLKASNAASLNAVFQQLTVEINKLMLTIDDKAVLNDTLSEYFDFNFTGSVTEGITIKTATVTGYNEATKEYSWQEDTDTNDYKAQPVSGSSKSFTVTGFDYKANAIRKTVEDGKEVYKGKKLIVTIPIKADTTKTSGWTAGKNYYDTNAADSAKLDNYTDEDGTARNTTLNDSPEAPVTGYTVTYAYGTGSEQPTVVNMPADTRAYIDGQTIDVKPTLTAPDGYTFDGWYTDAACTPTNKVDAANPPAINKANRTLYGKFTKSAFDVNLSTYFKKHLTLTGVIELPNAENFTITGAEYVMNGGTKKLTGVSFTGATGAIKSTPVEGTAFTGDGMTIRLSVGTHYFTVTETAGTTTSMTYAQPKDITITVAANAEGTGAVVTVNDGTITNTYAPSSDTFSLADKFQKTLNSNVAFADLPAGAKEFKLGIWEEANTTETADYIGTATISKLEGSGSSYSETVSFAFTSGLTFDTVGTKTYKVKEITDSVPGMKYDTTAYTMTIKVEDKAGKLTVTEATVSNGTNAINLLHTTGTNSLEITNTFTAATLPLDPPLEEPEEPDPMAGIKVIKSLTGDPKTETFRAQLLEGTTVKATASAAATTGTPVAFKDFGTLVFTEVGTKTYTIKEVNAGTAGMTYDSTEYTLTVEVVVGEGEDSDKLVIKSATYAYTDATGTVSGVDILTTPITFRNTYTKPTYAVKKSVVEDPSITVPTDVDKMGYQYPTGGKFIVEKTYTDDTITFLYVIEVSGKNGAEMTIQEQDGGKFINVDYSAETRATVTLNAAQDIYTVKLTSDVDANDPIKLYAEKTFHKDADGKFPTTATNALLVNGEEGPKDDTTIIERGSTVIDFSKMVQKHLTATGNGTVSEVTFYVDVVGGRRDDAIAYALPEVTISDTYRLVLMATFNSVTGNGYDETKPFEGAIPVNQAGVYIFKLTERTDAAQTSITYDETEYLLYVNVEPKSDGSLEVTDWHIVGSDNTEFNAPGKITFHNTIDTGKDDYYPIIIPTIINKDTGMLNKTDHFAYVIGYPDGTVHPNGQITRAEVATIFFRLLRDEVRDGAFTTSNSYSDVAYGKWYNNPISTMSALGIITGYPDGTFKPNKPITRAEFAAIAARFDETQSGKSATFSDVIGHWAAKEIGIAYYNDWIKGYPDGTFKPDQNITRAEAMTLINRVLERKPESPADLLTNMNKWTDNMDTSKWYYLDVQEATNSHGYTRKTFNYELWRQMLPDPDWSRYER